MAQRIISRIANWLANELITKRLANSPLFIDMAHRTHTHVQKVQKLAEKAAAKTGSQAGRTTTTTTTVLGKQFQQRRPQ
jgi:hypothetical protein